MVLAYWISACRRMKIDPYQSPCIKLKSKWIKDLNIKPTTLNLIEMEVVNTLECIGTGDHLLNITPIAQKLREKISKWNLLKLKSFCKIKDTVNKKKTASCRMGKDLHQPHIRQKTDLQNIQRTQEIGQQKNK